jgi:hypothetical protein
LLFCGVWPVKERADPQQVPKDGSHNMQVFNGSEGFDIGKVAVTRKYVRSRGGHIGKRHNAVADLGKDSQWFFKRLYRDAAPTKTLKNLNGALQSTNSFMNSVSWFKFWHSRTSLQQAW